MHTTRREILLVCAAALLALVAIGVRTAEAASTGPGSVLAFGANASGQLGRTATTTPSPTPAVHFEGRISQNVRLSPGMYDVAVRATNAQDMASGPRSLHLVVVSG